MSDTRHAIFSIDPGKTTGLALLLCEHRAPGVTHFSTFQIGTEQRPTDHSWVTGYERQALILYQAWTKFRRTALYQYDVPPANHVLVSEDFIVKPTMGSTKREALSPVFISMLLQGIRMGEAFMYEQHGLGPASLPPMRWSSPSQKSMASDARLRRAGFWVRGQEHSRSALRHGLLTAMKLGYAGVLSPWNKPRPPFYAPRDTERTF